MSIRRNPRSISFVYAAVLLLNSAPSFNRHSKLVCALKIFDVICIMNYYLLLPVSVLVSRIKTLVSE